MRQLITFILIILSLQLISCKNDTTKNKQENTEEFQTKVYEATHSQSTIKTIIDSGRIKGYTPHLYGIALLREFYANRNYKAAWTKQKSITDALKAISNLYDDGLNPEDYHYTDIKNIADKLAQNGSIDSLEYAKFDVLLSDAIATSAAHLISGKVDPESLKHKWDIPTESYTSVFDNAAATFQNAIDQSTISEEINQLKPTHYMYTGLKAALKEYRGYQEKGGWDSIATGPTIKLNDKSTRVLSVRARLLASNEMEEYVPANDTIYDSILQHNINRFQKKYGIEADGNVGKQTLYELNISASFRVEQIKVNLERARWVLYNLEDKYIAVNIAAFELYFIENNKELLTSRVIVGKQHTKSPIFKNYMQYVVINPLWTVPRSLYPGYIKKLQNNPGYFDKKNMEVVTNSGTSIDIHNTDWSQYNVHNFPYMIRQKAGPSNALGYIKCMFPNKYSVYIHDTPARTLFNKDTRAFSHGCIRTEKIRDVAELLLEPNNDGWSSEKINEIIATGKTTTISIKEKVPTLILYWTAGIGFRKNFYFKPDIYKRDPILIDALNKHHDY